MKDRILKIIALTLPAGIDALTKAFSLGALAGRDVVLINGVVSLHLTRNTGAAFSIMENVPWLSAALSFVIVSLVLIYALKAKLNRPSRLALLAVFSGGAANLIDRLINGAVTDMICLDFMRFPVFNFADICITLGVCVFAVFYLTERSDGDAADGRGNGKA